MKASTISSVTAARAAWCLAMMGWEEEEEEEVVVVEVEERGLVKGEYPMPDQMGCVGVG
jgi:hypothetical protein